MIRLAHTLFVQAVVKGFNKMDNRKERKISIVINGKEQYIRQVTNKNGEDQFQWDASPIKETRSSLLQVKDRLFDQKQKLTRLPLLNNQFKRTRINKKRGLFVKSQQALFILKKVWLSVVSAILIGTTLGILILMMFSGEHIFPQDAVGKSQPDESSPVATSLDNTDLTLSLYVIQGGAFETTETAETVANDLREKGFAAAIDPLDEPVRMYVGLGTSKERLKPIATEYEKEAEESYIKELTIEPTQTVDDSTSHILTSGQQYLLRLITEVEALFHGSSNAQLSNASDAHRKTWQQALEQLDDQLKDSQEFSTFTEGLERSFASLSTLRENDNSPEFWKVQQLLLDSLLAYQKLVND